MTEIQQNLTVDKLEELQAKAIKHKKSASKVLVFDASIVNSEIVKQLETKSHRNAFHTGQSPYLQNREGQIVINVKKCAHFVLPCIEYTLEREILADLIKQHDAKFAEDLLNETLEIGKKVTILEKYEIELDNVSRLREDYFIIKYASTEQIPEPGQIVDEPFNDLVKIYKETFKVDPKFLEYIFLNSLKDIESSERLLSIIHSTKEDKVQQDVSKQQQLMDKLNLKEFIGEKMLHLPVYKKETGFFNYSQYQVLNLETQKLSEPKEVEKPNYLI